VRGGGEDMRLAGSERNVGTKRLRLVPGRYKPLAVTSPTNSIQFHSSEQKTRGGGSSMQRANERDCYPVSWQVI
jgi:hypothetical protein